MKKKSENAETEAPPRVSTGGRVLPKLPPIPSTRGERISPVEAARGIGTNEPGNPSAMPRRTIGPHGLPPAGLDARERGIFFMEGWGSIETRTGVLWDREYTRRLKLEGQRGSAEREIRPGVNQTGEDQGRPMVEMPWSIHGVVWNLRAT